MVAWGLAQDGKDRNREDRNQEVTAPEYAYLFGVLEKVLKLDRVKVI